MLKIETFEKHLNSTFSIPFDDGTNIDIVLFNIIKGQFIEALNIQPFTLEFKAKPDTILLRQNTYNIKAPDNQDFALLLIPRSSNEEGHTYDCNIG